MKYFQELNQQDLQTLIDLVHIEAYSTEYVSDRFDELIILKHKLMTLKSNL